MQATERLVDGAALADAAATTEGGNTVTADATAGTAAAAATAAAEAEVPLRGQHVAQLLQRLLLPRIKATLGESNLAVRQVCVSCTWNGKAIRVKQKP